MAVVNIDDHEASRARRFLLGRLSDEEAEQFEARLLGDAPLFETVKAVEEELLDELVRGVLAPEEREIVAARFERQPERVRFARALSDRANRKPLSRWWPAAAAALLLLIGAGALWRATLSGPGEAVQSIRSRGPRTSPPDIALRRVRMVTYTIVLAATRDDDRAPRLTLAPDVTTLALRIRLHPADRYSTYDVAVKRSDGTSVWSGSVATRSGNDIAVQLPASLLAPGEYAISVDGLDGNRRREELGEQTLTIDRKSPPRSPSPSR